MVFKENYFQYKDTDWLKGWKKILHANTNNKAGMAICI